ncbi:unnamed protein product [Microthlaspi erraticum]|uniref:Bidirectional sugar transporter SWEET n=1 Tax=Microthlaspi erraticum TaxID=1685480 RepID=A0A6D2KDX5_9BRAS|nr:unnamed protein product [Microthlaspi erraticum]
MDFVAVERFGRPNSFGRENSAEAERMFPGSTGTVGPFRYENFGRSRPIFPGSCVRANGFCRAMSESGRARLIPSRLDRNGRPDENCSAKILCASAANRLTVKFFLLVDVFAFGLIYVLTYFLFHGNKRLQVLGYICMVFALSVFVAPLGIIRKVIKTKSAEFMPFGLSFFLTLSAVMWFFYGLLTKDLNVALPNVLGFIFGVLQMILYLIYKKPGTKVLEPPGIKLQDITEHVVDVVRLSTMVCSSQMRTLVPQDSADMEATIALDEKIKGDIEKIKEEKEVFLINKN